MSETTSPNATIFPKAPSCSVSRQLHVYLAPDLLVGVASLPQRRDDVPLQVRHVAGDQARLTLRNYPYLSYGRRQYARLGPFEPLCSSRVFDPHRVPHVREGEAAFGVGSVDDPTRHVHGVPRPYRVTRHHGVVVLDLERLEELLARQALFDPGQDCRFLGGPEYVPRFGLAVGLPVLFLGGLVVRVEVDGEHVRGVEDLLEEREVRAAPALPDELLGEPGDEVVERLSGVLAVGDSSRSVPVV